MSSKPDQPASMIGGHATFAKGYVEETIGNVTGSMEWQESGKKDAQAGIDEMRVSNFYSSTHATRARRYYPAFAVSKVSL